MAHSDKEYDIIVISTDPTGMEAATQAARAGKTALLLQLNPGAVASVMCSTPVHGFTEQHPLAGVEASLIRPDEPGADGSPVVRSSPQPADSHHSVYILQSSGGLAPFRTRNGITPEGAEEPGWEAGEGQWSADAPENTDPDPADAEPAAETHLPAFTGADLLHERELRNRRRLLHRTRVPSFLPREEPTAKIAADTTSPVPSTATETDRPPSPPPVFREREINLRKRLSGAVRRPGPSSRKPALPASDESTEEWKQESWPTDSVVPPRMEKPVPPHPEQESAETLYSSSVIPMDQGRLKYRRQGRFKDPESQPAGKPEPFTRKQRRAVRRSEDEIPGPIVWEADRGPTRKKETEPAYEPEETGTSTQEGPLSFRNMTYEPFSRTRRSLEQHGRKKETPAKGPLSYQLPSPAADTPSKSAPLRENDPPRPREKRIEKTTPSNTFREEAAPRQQPFHGGREMRRDPSTFMGEEEARNVLENSSGLKRDSIDIEDPYGQSYEDFLEPFAHNNPQSEQLERRKLALRGLHNLINNLG